MSTVVLVCVLVLGCCSIVAIVLAAVAISRDPDINVSVGKSELYVVKFASSKHRSQRPCLIIQINTSSPGYDYGAGSSAASGPGMTGLSSNGKRIYTIAIAHDWGAHEYL